MVHNARVKISIVNTEALGAVLLGDQYYSRLKLGPARHNDSILEHGGTLLSDNLGRGGADAGGLVFHRLGAFGELDSELDQVRSSGGFGVSSKAVHISGE